MCGGSCGGTWQRLDDAGDVGDGAVTQGTGLVAVATRGTPRWSTMVALISFTKLIHRWKPPNRDVGGDGMVSVIGQNW